MTLVTPTSPRRTASSRSVVVRRIVAVSVFAVILATRAHPSGLGWSDAPSDTMAPPVLTIDGARHRPTAAEAQEISTLIAALRPETEEADEDPYQRQRLEWLFGTRGVEPAGRPAASCIAPMAGDWSLRHCPAAWRLIELGPKAMPALLAALDDATPVARGQGLAGSHIGDEDDERPIAVKGVSERELRIIDQALPARPGHEFVDWNTPVCRGDLCLVVLGQIVNRHYPRWDHRWSLTRSASPVHNPEVARVVRELWTSSDPALLLMESLLDDMRRNGRFSHGALNRLAFYYPEESSGFLAREISSGRSIGGVGVWLADETMATIAARPAAEVLDALVQRLEHSSTTEEVAALLRPSVVAAAPELALRKGLAAATHPGANLFDATPPRILARFLELLPKDASAVFDLAASAGSAESRRVALGVLALASHPPDWMVAFAAPLLEDPAPVAGTSGGYQSPQRLRVCDLAALTLVQHSPDLSFDDAVDVDARDRQIDVIREHLRAMAAGELAPTLARIDPVGEALISQPGGWVWLPLGFDRNRASALTVSACGQGDPAVFSVDLTAGTVSRSPLQIAPGATVSCLSGVRVPGDRPVILVDGQVRTVEPQDGATAPFGSVVLPAELVGVAGHNVVTFADSLVWIAPGDEVHCTRLSDGQTTRIWKSTGQPEDSPPRSVHLLPLLNPDRVLVWRFASDEVPAEVVDPASGAVEALEGMPDAGWAGGSGDLIWNNMNSRIVVWDLARREPVTFPGRGATQLVLPRATAGCSIAYALERDGQVAVIDLTASRRLAMLVAPAARHAHLLLSFDGRTLLRVESIKDEQASGPPDAVHIVAWDVSAWANK